MNDTYRQNMKWRILLIPIVAGMHSGCSATRPFDPATAARIRAESLSEFNQGIYYKPSDNGLTGIERELAPLVIDETTSKRPPVESSICTPTGLKENPCDTETATIYSAISNVVIAGRRFDQICYVWFYHQTNGAPSPRGVRIILGGDGFPMLWEPVNPNRTTRKFFVARSLEERARQEFGAAMQNRSFSIETATRDAPDVVVARVLDDGPVPMGPWVYVSRSPERRITTLLCRCMPSQVNEFVKTVKYDLQPIEAIPDADRSSWIHSLTQVEDMTRLFRWGDVAALAGTAPRD